MRLHRLQVQAFGPFAGTEVIDFDALTSSGLFLLYGPTGAGKTSVLDVVCFALYGRVPGARAGTNLRSDHAPPGLAPEVVCEFSVGTRRIRVTRSPAWERPKSRGEGTTKANARVTVAERVESRWTARTSRLDEAALFLADAVGLDHEQFTKLVLLPQGEFAAFLRAGAETRRAMLEKLFDTKRFSLVQQVLGEQQRRLGRAVEEAAAVTETLTARAKEAARAVCPPPPPDPDVLPGFELPEPDPVTLVRTSLQAAVLEWEDANSRAAGAARRRDRAQAARVAGELLAARQSELATWRTRDAELARETARFETDRRRLLNAERAAGLAAVLAPLPELTADEQRSAAAARRAADRLVALDLPPDAGEERLQAHREQAREERAGLTALLAETAGLEQARAALAVAIRQEEAVRAQAAAEQAGTEALRTALADLEEQVGTARTAAADEPAAAEALTRAEAVAAALVDLAEIDRQLDAAATTLLQAREQRVAAAERSQDLRERRLAGMAAELAAELQDGRPCPVCGGQEHPAPAVAAATSVTDADEQAARARLTTAETALAAAQQSAQDLAARRAAVAERTGGQDAPGATAAVHQARARRATAVDALTRAGELDRQIRRHKELVAAGEQAATVTRQRLEAAAAARIRCHTEVEALAAKAAQARGAQGLDPAARLAALTETVAAVDEVLRTRADADRAGAALRSATAVAQSAVQEAGFPDVAAAAAAIMPAPRRQALREALERYDTDRATVAVYLVDADLLAAAEQPAPDLAQLVSAHGQAEADLDAQKRRVALADSAISALRGIDAELTAHLERTGPLTARYAVLRDLARCADGTGGGNDRRMSLSAYVVAARLEQVAAAATARLAQMSGGRYRLVHSDERELGERRAGLGLRVVDEWTGQARETSSLSGGESFYTSLALALGLADVVSAEAGGLSVETLFVDEGFGTLDEDTLDEVMDVLDGLRSGGRTVGLVSHVAELRGRIPAQVEVLKGRDGSHVRVTAGG